MLWSRRLAIGINDGPNLKGFVRAMLGLNNSIVILLGSASRLARSCGTGFDRCQNLFDASRRYRLERFPSYFRLSRTLAIVSLFPSQGVR